MDGNLFYGSSDVRGAVAAVEKLIDRIVDTGGFGAIDWHVQASVPSTQEYHDWGVAYQSVLRSLAARRDVWVTNLGSIAGWVAGRARMLRHESDPGIAPATPVARA
jgi:hypothetical protein